MENPSYQWGKKCGAPHCSANTVLKGTRTVITMISMNSDGNCKLKILILCLINVSTVFSVHRVLKPLTLWT